ncbi:MAG: FtsW/RodA/SpoVE family cell cycle protein [Phycisphaerales bacterium]|nr:FtsW/RodA/SpoVE family cell cycle protein [Phycisphaerales bacterium]
MSRLRPHTRLTRAGLLRALRTLASPAWLCVGASLALSLVSLAAIDLATDREGAAFIGPVARKQGVFLAVGLLAAAAITLPHYRRLVLVALPAHAAAVALLIFVLIPVVPESIVRPRPGGVRAWISLGIADFQPAELAKITYVLVVARYLRFRKEHRRFLGLVPLALITFVPGALIILQPDLGTACLFVPSLFAMLLGAGARLRHLGVIVLAAALAAPAMYPLLRPHQKARIVGLWRQMQGDRTTADGLNYQAYTAQTIASAGGLSGMPADHARAIIHYNSLPEAHNDMVIAVIMCRWGLLGGVGVLALYALWIAGALATAATARDPFGRLLVLGLAAFIAAQVVINVGMNLGLLPIIGITLPFVSYGGSSILICWLMSGLILSVGVHRTRGFMRRSFEYDDEEPG